MPNCQRLDVAVHFPRRRGPGHRVTRRLKGQLQVCAMPSGLCLLQVYTAQSWSSGFESVAARTINRSATRQYCSTLPTLPACFTASCASLHKAGEMLQGRKSICLAFILVCSARVSLGKVIFVFPYAGGIADDELSPFSAVGQ